MRWQGYGGQGYNWRLLLPGTQYDYEAAAGDLWRNSAVACCLRWIRVNFPEPRLEVIRKLGDGKDQVVGQSELVRLLHRPNGFYDRFTFSAACSLSYVVDGNCYIRKIRSASGKVVELWWIPHWLIFPRWRTDGTEFIGWYDYEVNGNREKIPIKDIIHWKSGSDPRDDRKGFSELKQGVRSICGLNECDTYTAAILRNMGIVGALISVDNSGEMPLDQGEIDVMRDQWREDHTSEGRGSPLIAPRPMKVQRVAMSPEELRLDKIPARLEDTIHALIGLSPMVTGASSGKDHKTYANYGEARKAAYEDCLIPMQGSFAECLTWNLLQEDFSEGDQVRWDYSGVKCLAQNETEVAERLGRAYQVYQGITRAEYRAGIGFDFTPEDEVFFDEASLRTVDGEVDPDDDEEDDGSGIGVESQRSGDEQRLPFGVRARTPGTPPGDIDDEHEDNTFQLPDGRPIRRELKKWFKKQLADVLGEMPGIGAPLPATFPSLADYDDPMASAMTPMLSGYWDEAGKTTQARLGLDPGNWKVHDVHLHDQIKDAALSFCKETNATTSKDLGNALRELRTELVAGLIDNGDSIPELTKRVMKVFENCSKSRAQMIARSEASRAVHSASIKSAEESGVVQGKKWLVSGNSCDKCVEVAEKVNAAFPQGIPLGTEFAHQGKNPAYSSIKHPPLHPRCRCSMTYVLTGEYEQLLEEHGPPHFDTFQEGSLGPEPKPARKIKKPENKATPEAAATTNPKKPGPAGTPVGDALSVRAKGSTREAIKEAIATVDSVHGDGALPVIPLDERRSGDALGQYRRSALGKAFDITINPEGDHIRMTTAHEIGHFIDFEGIPGRPWLSLMDRNYRSDPKFAAWVKAVDESEAVKALRDRQNQKTAAVAFPSGKSYDYPIDQKHVKYLLTDVELWARSYAQYIATKSKNPAMLKELVDDMKGDYAAVYHHQWEHNDFAPIESAIDDLFKGLGWIK